MITMKTKHEGRWIFAVGMVLLSVPAFGQEEGGATAVVDEPFKLGAYEFSAEPELQFQYVNGDRQSAKFNEYRDLTTGVAASGKAHMSRDAYYMDLAIKNAGRSNQEYSLSGGQYDQFSYNVYLNETPHNLSYHASTFYEGVGGTSLTYTNHPYYGPIATPATATTTNDKTVALGGAVGWVNTFDYSYRRYAYGGTGRLSLFAPFYGDFGVERTTMSGIRPMMQGTTAIELPAQIDFANNTAFMELGFRQDSLKFSARYDFSNFVSNADYIYYQSVANPGGTSSAVNYNLPDKTDHATLAPSSLMSKVTVNGVVGDLPLDSTLNMNGSWAWLSSNVTLDPQSATRSLGVETVNNPVFEGDIQFRKADLSLTSRPISKLNTRAYASYLQNYNKSTEVTTAGISTSGVPKTNGLYNFHRANAGFDAGYRLPLESKVRVGYQFVSMIRPNREDAPHSTDHGAFLRVSNSYLDWLDASLKAEMLYRTTEYEGFGAVDPANLNTKINHYVRPFDAASKTMWKLTAETDFTPLENLSVDLSYGIWRDKYRDTLIGMTNSQTSEGYLSAAYSFMGGVRVNGFVDAQYTDIESNHRYMNRTNPAGSTTVTGDGDPASGNNASGAKQAFNWGSTEKDTSWGYGLGLDVPVFSKLNVGVSWLQDISSGSRAFAADPSVASIVQLQDIGNLDKLRHSLFNVKAAYAFTSRLSTTIGFMFDRLTYEDDGWVGYELKPETSLTGGSPAAYLTGAYNDSSYAAQVYYISATYRL